MATTRSILTATGLLAAATLLTVGTASATATAGNVLTYPGKGGTAVSVGDVLTGASSLVTVTTAPGGSTGITCDHSDFSATVNSNPAASGTATETLNSLNFGGTCTVNIPGLTGVKSVTANGLPLPTDVSSAGVVTLHGPLSATAVLTSLLGDVNCAYGAASMVGTADSSVSKITFTDQKFDVVSGSNPNCPSTAYLSVAYSPITDVNVGQPVFVN